jgi:phage baseplate assembly protein W
MKGLSPKFPLTFNNVFGAYDLNQSYSDLVKQNLKNLILTSPGERVMDVNFGVGLRHYFFEQLTGQTSSLIATRIREQVSQYMPFVEILEIKFNPEENFGASPNLLYVQIHFAIQPLGQPGVLTIESST